jgi:hypothetical protein
VDANSQPNRGFKGFHPNETVRSFSRKYLEMHARFVAKNEEIPINMADAMSLFFSEKVWERLFMIKMWELLYIYSNEDYAGPRDMSDLKYPDRYFKEDGPIPIYAGTGFLAFAATVARRDHKKGTAFRWTDDQYRYAILAMRAVSHF